MEVWACNTCIIYFIISKLKLVSVDVETTLFAGRFPDITLKRRRCHQSLGCYLYNADITSNHSVVNSKNTDVALPSFGHYFRSANVVNNNSAVTPKSDNVTPSDSATTSEAPMAQVKQTEEWFENSKLLPKHSRQRTSWTINIATIVNWPGGKVINTGGDEIILHKGKLQNLQINSLWVDTSLLLLYYIPLLYTTTTTLFH